MRCDCHTDPFVEYLRRIDSFSVRSKSKIDERDVGAHIRQEKVVRFDISVNNAQTVEVDKRLGHLNRNIVEQLKDNKTLDVRLAAQMYEDVLERYMELSIQEVTCVPRTWKRYKAADLPLSL